ncbi:MAG: hypothetical protein K9L60_05770 [Methylovulum sp.]|nr:hypothetical protein [Methylovulum sp.]MCF7998722.1 hypothetical protein [Methylovulum sp.]
MKNSFFLVIPKQQPVPERLKEFEAKALAQWIAELPFANPLLATRLFYEYLVEFNSIKMPAQLKLDALEQLQPSLQAVENYLISRLVQNGFPKDNNDNKTLGLLAAIEKQFTLGYWIIIKELTGHDISWFQGKNAALSIQRCIKGLSSLVKTYLMMGMSVPNWIWMDLHSLYKLSVKIKKNTAQVPSSHSGYSNKTSSPEIAYLQIILLSLADARGLMQKEIALVYDFIETIQTLVSFKHRPIQEQAVQCVIFTDEDMPPLFLADDAITDVDSAKLYVNVTKLLAVLDQGGIAINTAEARFNALHVTKNAIEQPTKCLLDYLQQRWSGVQLQSAPIFSDRLDRYLAIGLTSTFKLQKALTANNDEQLEYLAHSASNRMLSCVFNKTDVLSVGSLVSFRRIDAPEHKRFLGIVDLLVVEKEEGGISFGVNMLTHHCIPVTYLPLNATMQTVPKPGLFYKSQESEGGSYLITETYLLKDNDVIRLFIHQEDFTILLRKKENIGIGYWCFECMQITEKRK